MLGLGVMFWAGVDVRCYIVYYIHYYILYYYILLYYYIIHYTYIYYYYILYLILYSSPLLSLLFLFPSYSSSPHLYSSILPFSSPPSLLFFPILISPSSQYPYLFPILIQSIRVGIWIHLFIFNPHQQFDPACFIGVDGWGV